MPASNSFFLTSFTSPRSVAENNIFISCACQELHPPGAAAQIRRVRIIASGIHREQSLEARQTGGGLLLPRVSVLTCRGAVSLSSRGGEGEPLARCSRLADACEVQTAVAPPAWKRLALESGAPSGLDQAVRRSAAPADRLPATTLAAP